jgi:integrase
MARQPSYRLHKASGQACTKIRGKVYYFGPYGSPESKRKFDHLVAQYLLSNQSATFGVDPSAITWAEAANAYLDFAEQYYRESTEADNLQLALKPISEVFADQHTKDFRSAHFKQVQQWWVRRGVSRGYSNKQCNRLLRVIKWLVAEGLMPVENYQQIKCVEPLRKGRTPATENQPVGPVSDAVIDATVPYLSPIVSAMVKFQRLTGCRPGEVVRIKPSMVDRSNAVWEIRLEKHKTAYRGHTRTIYVGPAAQELLKPFLSNRHEDEFCFQPFEVMRQFRKQRESKRVTPLSCGNRKGTNRVERPRRKPGACYTTQSYGRAIANACKKAFPPPEGLSKSLRKKWICDHAWAPNQLRHAHATAIRRLHGLEAASVLLGHSDLEITKLYAERDRQLAIDLVAKHG